MYLSSYIWFLVPILLCMMLSAFASARVRSSFEKHNGTPCSSAMNGYEVARRLLVRNGVDNVSIGSVGGFLSDHYHPKKQIVNLSESTYMNNSISAVAVAAHEIGHVMQRKNGYFLYRARTALVPVVNFGTNLAMPLVLVGILLDALARNVESNIGFYVAMAGVILYGSALVFALVTLPVEINASRRAKKMLISEGILHEGELGAASEVLSAAAMTYLVSLLTSVVYFMRFLFQVLAIFGGRRSRR